MSAENAGLRPLPEGFPMDFVVTDDAANFHAGPGACPIQMQSRSTGAITLLRVEYLGRSIGDYHVDAVDARFSLREDELVRFDCNDVRPLGIVPWPDGARPGGPRSRRGRP